MVKNTRMPLLDERLNQALCMVPECECCADVGADHGLLSLALLVSKRVKHMYVSDISEKALQKSKNLLAKHGLSEYATYNACDGLSELPAFGVDTICILGMGGQTVEKILEDGQSKLQNATLVLGAQTDLPSLRKKLPNLGYCIEKESIIKVGKHFYVLMRCIPEKNQIDYNDAECWLGPRLMHEPSQCYYEWLMSRVKTLDYAIKSMQTAKNNKDEMRLKLTMREKECTMQALHDIKDRGVNLDDNSTNNSILAE